MLAEENYELDEKGVIVGCDVRGKAAGRSEGNQRVIAGIIFQAVSNLRSHTNRRHRCSLLLRDGLDVDSFEAKQDYGTWWSAQFKLHPYPNLNRIDVEQTFG